MTEPFDPGFDIRVDHENMTFVYGEDVFGPEAEHRKLDSIRQSLADPACDGPDIVYAIAMDVGKKIHYDTLKERMLLFGVVTYASGRLGREPVRSQGHVHKISRHSGWSPPELYEIWSGQAIIYMQEKAADNPGKCYAVQAGPGEVVVVPPGWAHATISADPQRPLTFGAWCDREYGFEYEEVRKRRGLAWYPLLHEEGGLDWKHNGHYAFSPLIKKMPGDYSQLGIERGKPIYAQFEENPDRFQWVSKPELVKEIWTGFVP